jgi:ribonuclease BN (tRNA processing enzyme)
MRDGLTRRRALQGAAAAAAAGMVLPRTPAAKAQDPTTVTPVVSRGKTKVVMLGSLGGQQMTPLVGANVRCGTSVLIDVDGEVTVLDCGCGSVHRVVEAGYELSQVRRILITHCHFDHISDLTSMAYFAWTAGRNSGRGSRRRIDVHGPTGIGDIRRHFHRSMRTTIADQQGPLGQTPRFSKFAHWHEFAPPKKAKGVYETDRVEVRAIRVKHGSMPSVGYRVKTPDVDLAFSGDRGDKGDRFAEFAKGADVLFSEIIHEQLVLAQLNSQKPKPAKSFVEHLIYDHTTPGAVGRLATDAGVPVLVLYHLVPGTPGISDDHWRSIVSPTYDGQIIVSKDLMLL